MAFYSLVWWSTYFFMTCLVLNACSFCVAGLIMSSDGETNFCSLSWRQYCTVVHDQRTGDSLLAIIHTRLQNLAVEFETLNILLLRCLLW